MVGVKLISLLLLCVATLITGDSVVTFQFPEFDYKETLKNVG